MKAGRSNRPADPKIVMVNLMKNNAAVCEGTILDQKILITFDTGAGVGLIREDAARNCKKLINDKYRLRTIDNKEIPDYGLAIGKIKLGKAWIEREFVVVENCPTEVLFGEDIFSEFGFDILYSRKAVHSEETGELPFARTLEETKEPGQVKINYLTATKKIKIQVSEKITIPARSKTWVPIAICGLEEKQEAIVTPKKTFYTKNQLIVPHMLINQETKQIMLINPTTKDKKLSPRTQLGKLDLVKIEAGPPKQVSEEPKAGKPEVDLSQLDMNKNIPEEDLKKVRVLLEKHTDAFSWDGRLGRATRLKFKINTGEAEPIRQRPYPVSEKQRQVLQEHVEDMLKKDIIEPSESPWASPCILVDKKPDKTGKIKKRFCVDFRAVNLVTKKMSYPLPRIEDILARLRNSKYFSTLDLASGFWQVELQESDREKSAFVTPDGLFQFKVMAFGLANSPPQFASLMDLVLSGLKNEKVLCYVDDLIIYSRTIEEHLQKLDKVLSRLKSENLLLQPSKCKLLYNEISVLGFIVNSEGVKIDPSMLNAVTKLENPKTKKHVQKLLGFFSYFRKFIRNFGDIVRPMQRLLPNEAKFEWKEEQQEALNTMKKALVTAPVLALFDPEKETILKTDASTFGVGTAIFQIHDKIEKPVAFASRALIKSQKNWTTTELELLAVIFGIKRFQTFLKGKEFKIHTDHHALCWILKQKKEEMSPKLVRMVEFLSNYQIEGIYHVSGANHVADCLSRFPVDLPKMRIAQENEIEELEDAPILLTRPIIMSEAQRSDPHLKSIIESLENDVRPSGTKKGKYSMHNSLLYYWNYRYNRKVLVIPNHMTKIILSECHDGPLSAHLGFTKTRHRVESRYFWKSMISDIKNYVKTCENCQRRKVSTFNTHGLMQKMSFPREVFNKVQIDVMGPFPRSTKGKKYVVTAICYLSKWIESRALSEATAESIADFVIEQILCRHGCPGEVQSDRGTTFTAEIFKHITGKLGISHQVSTARHPQSQGLVEKSHSTLNTCISMYISSGQKDWDRFLPHITFAINTSIQETTKCTPFFSLRTRSGHAAGSGISSRMRPQEC